MKHNLVRRNALVLILCILCSSTLIANTTRVVNVYAWGGEIPRQVIQQFERDTGIRVNFSTYDSNETMYAKLHSSKHAIYDVVLPSAYFVERMKKRGMLIKLDHNKLPNLENLDPRFIQNEYDDGNNYAAPLIWGATGIFYNQKWVKQVPQSWQALWDPVWRGQLMLLDDSREVFSMALMSLNYPPNDTDPAHILAAYQKLLTLIPNIKLFGSDGIQSVMIDGDAIAGLAWTGDVFKAHAENKQINFVYPQGGFVIWVDCLAIPTTPPHPDEAYEFINYMLKPETAVKIALLEGHAITNKAALSLLPAAIRNDKTLYPPAEILQHGHVQRDLGEETLALYNHYWQALKLAF